MTIDGTHHRHCGGFREGDDETTDAVLFNSTDFKLGLTNHVMEIVNVGHDGHKTDSVFDINRVCLSIFISSRLNILISVFRLCTNTQPTA